MKLIHSGIFVRTALSAVLQCWQKVVNICISCRFMTDSLTRQIRYREGRCIDLLPYPMCLIKEHSNTDIPFPYLPFLSQVFIDLSILSKNMKCMYIWIMWNKSSIVIWDDNCSLLLLFSVWKITLCSPMSHNINIMTIFLTGGISLSITLYSTLFFSVHKYNVIFITLPQLKGKMICIDVEHLYHYHDFSMIYINFIVMKTTSFYQNFHFQPMANFRTSLFVRDGASSV